jgi:hypothetical protein
VVFWVDVQGRNIQKEREIVEEQKEILGWR